MPIMSCALSQRLADWRAAWESLDPERIVALYAADAVHESAAAGRALPWHAGARLSGRGEIEAFVASACRNLCSFRIEPRHVVEHAEVSVIEYRRVFNDDESRAVLACEVIQWRDSRVAASRVYHA